MTYIVEGSYVQKRVYRVEISLRITFQPWLNPWGLRAFQIPINNRISNTLNVINFKNATNANVGNTLSVRKRLN
jgi:hypothetical protein